MANGGWHGTQPEWAAAEYPLPSLDPILTDFAKTNGLTLYKNYKDWPERSLKASMPLSSLIQIYRVDLISDAWRAWVVCSEDRSGERFWKRTFVADGITSHELTLRLESLLREGLTLLVEWNVRPQDLEFATKLASLP